MNNKFQAISFHCPNLWPLATNHCNEKKKVSYTPYLVYKINGWYEIISTNNNFLQFTTMLQTTCPITSSPNNMIYSIGHHGLDFFDFSLFEPTGQLVINYGEVFLEPQSFQISWTTKQILTTQSQFKRMHYLWRLMTK